MAVLSISSPIPRSSLPEGRDRSPSARIPQVFLDQLLAGIDLVAVIGRYVALIKTGKEYKARCPFHEEKTPSFTVVPHKGFYHCFGCQAHGNAITFVMRHERQGFRQAVALLAQQADLSLPAGIATSAVGNNDKKLWLAQAQRFYQQQLRTHPRGHQALQYLQQRGIGGPVIDDFALGFAPDGGTHVLKGCHRIFCCRLIFPIRDKQGRTLAFGGRAMTNESAPKYVNSSTSTLFKKTYVLYGLYEVLAVDPMPKTLVVVEGYLDVISLTQHGIRHAVATLGTAVSSVQIEQLFSVANHLVFCFDGDQAGRKAAWQALIISLPLLQIGRQISILSLPDGDDPDSLVRKEGGQAFELRLNDAMPASTFLLQHLIARYDTDTLEGRSQLMESARPLLRRLPDGVFKTLLIHRLNLMVGLDLFNDNGHLIPLAKDTCGV